MKNKILILTIALFTTSAVGCSLNISINKNQETPKLTEDYAEEVPEGKIIVKHFKGETALKINPKKIAVFEMGVLDTLNKIGADVELAVPVASVPSHLKDYAKNAVDAGGIKEPNLETLYEFAPEAIFISVRQESYYEELNKIAPTIYVDIAPETYIEDVINMSDAVSRLFEKEELAYNDFEKITEKVQEMAEKISKRNEKALIILTNDGSISAYGKGSRFGLIHDVLGVKQADENIEVSTHGQSVSYEYISKVNPDILFVVDRTKVAGGTNVAENTLNNDLIKNTNAGKNGKIIYLNPETWYLSNAGINALETMLFEISSAFDL